MTREEAVKILKNNSTYWGEDSAEDFCKAYEMAIEALKAEPETLTSGYAQEIRIAEPCADCVSRQDAKDMLKARAKFLMDTYHEPTDLEMIKLIDELPSVTPAPKVGRWIYKSMKGQFCSICDEQSMWKFNYCPNCGAKMEVEE